MRGGLVIAGLSFLGCTFNSLPLTPPDAGSPSPAPECVFPTGATIESSAHVRLAHLPAGAACTGSIDYLERTAQAQAALLGLEPGTLCYTVWPVEAWANGPCPRANGCTQLDGMIHSPKPDVTHELVHAMRRTAWTVPLLEEGIAVSLGDDGYDTVLEDYQVSPRARLGGEAPVNLAGH